MLGRWSWPPKSSREPSCDSSAFPTSANGRPRRNQPVSEGICSENIALQTCLRHRAGRAVLAVSNAAEATGPHASLGHPRELSPNERMASASTVATRNEHAIPVVAFSESHFLTARARRHPQPLWDRPQPDRWLPNALLPVPSRPSAAPPASKPPTGRSARHSTKTAIATWSAWVTRSSGI